MRRPIVLALVGLCTCRSPNLELAEDAPLSTNKEGTTLPALSDRPTPPPRPASTGEVKPLRSSERSADTWIDLLAARPLTTRYVDRRLVIDLSDPSARIHLDPLGQSAWRLGAREGEVYAGAVVGRVAAIDFALDGGLEPANYPVDEEGRPGLALAITLKAAAPRQALTVFFNDRPLANLQVGEEWARRTFSLPIESVRSGENRLRLHFSRTNQGPEPLSAWISLVEVGSRTDIVLAPSDLGRGKVRFTTQSNAALVIPAGSALAYYTVLPRRARLRLRVSGPGRLLVRAQAQAESAAKTQAPATFDLELGSVVARDHVFDLSGFADTPTRLEFAAAGLANQVITLESLVVESPRSLPALVVEPGIRDVYVVTVEGVRADIVANPQPWGVELPTWKALQQQGFWASHAYATSSAAVPSHAGWLASTEPGGSWTVRGTYVAGARELLSEHLGRSGYASLLINANVDVNDGRGLTQGFAQVLDVRELGRSSLHARDLMRIAIERAQALRAPKFVWLNLSDPQAPYEPVSELVEALPPALARLAESMPNRLWVERVRAGKFTPSANQLEYVKRLYAAEVVEVDHALGELVAALRKQGTWERSIVVVMGVHGEEFLDHGGAGHGRTLHEESIRVPLAIIAPGLIEPSSARTTVSLIDVAPTLTELLSIAPSAHWQGQSLVRRFGDAQPPLGFALAHQADGSRAFIVGHYKLVLPPAAAAKPPLLFDLASDPHEAHDLSNEHGFLLRMMRGSAVLFLAHERAWKRARWGTPMALDADFSRDNAL